MAGLLPSIIPVKKYTEALFSRLEAQMGPRLWPAPRPFRLLPGTWHGWALFPCLRVSY